MSVSEPLELDVIALRRNPWVTAASCIPWMLVPFLILASVATGGPFAAFVPHLTIVGGLIFFGAWRRMPSALNVRSRMRIDDTSVRIGDEVIARSEITKVELVPTISAPMIRIERRGRMVANLLTTRDDEQAHAILRALGFDASQRTAAYRLGSLALVRFRYVAFLLAPLAFLVVFLGATVGLNVGPIAFPLMGLVFAFAFLKRASLVVGADGLFLHWLWVREFLATKDIVGTSRFETGFGRNRVRGIEVFSKTGQSMRLPVSRAWGDDLTATIEQRINDVKALEQNAEHVANEALVLARGDLALRDWIGRLKALGAGATATLRTAAIMPEQLWRVASDTAQPPITRAAAAVALAPSLDDSGRARLADLAKATAVPKLRIALEHAAEDADEDTLEGTLRDLEEKN